MRSAVTSLAKSQYEVDLYLNTVGLPSWEGHKNSIRKYVYTCISTGVVLNNLIGHLPVNNAT